jgi:hypothetical protein
LGLVQHTTLPLTLCGEKIAMKKSTAETYTIYLSILRASASLR